MPRLAVLLLISVTAGACFVGEDEAQGDETAGEEDELRFRPSNVDTTLPDVDALGYEVKLKVDDANRGRETFTAEVKGTYVATKAAGELVLDFEGNHVDDVRVGTRIAEHRREGSKLIVKLPARVSERQTFTTRIKVHGDVRQSDGANPNDFSAFGGLMVKQRNAEGKRIFTTLSWPSKARRWLPLRDHPRDGAMVAFDVTFPKSYLVLANGKKLGESENADGTKTWRYEANTDMPTYDFHVSAYDGWKVEEKRSQTQTIATYTYANAARHVPTVYGDIGKAMDFYEKTYGKYRWEQASFIEEPIFGGGMEHAGVISMDETLFSDPAGARDTAFHELAHHWSGNLVRVRRWNDFWLSEGFTEYLTERALFATYGADERRRVLHEYLSTSLSEDRSNPHALAPRGDEIDVLTIFDGISYQKGALTVRMLERILGTEKMDAFLEGWFDRHAFGAVTSEDLQREISEAAGRDLKSFFDSFVYSGYHPELKVTFDATNVRVEQIQTKGIASGFVFPLDLEFTDAAGQKKRIAVDLTGKVTTKAHGLASAPTSVIVDPDEYAIATVTCGQNAGTTTQCKTGYRCASSFCVPD
jgi:aminopeptidase N